MLAWHIPRWALPVAIGGVLAIAGGDIVLMRRHRIAAPLQGTPEEIGLHADAEGDFLRVQWNRHSRPVLNADHAILFIEDGDAQSKLDLTGRELDSASVIYRPESEQGTFRLEVYRGSRSSSDSAPFGLAKNRPRGRRTAGHLSAARAVVERSRPSPFERVAPEIEITDTLPVRVVAAPMPETLTSTNAAPEVETETRAGRVIDKIPLLRRLRKHPATGENGQQ